MLKTIRKFTFEEFLAAISTRNVSFKTLKRVYLGFCLILVDTNVLLYINELEAIIKSRGELDFLQFSSWSRRGDSNARPPRPERGALPTALLLVRKDYFLSKRVQRYYIFLRYANILGLRARFLPKIRGIVIRDYVFSGRK